MAKKNYWLDAVKEVNKGSDKYCIPKKNSDMYNKVKKIADDNKKRDQEKEKDKDKKPNAVLERMKKKYNIK